MENINATEIRFILKRCRDGPMVSADWLAEIQEADLFIFLFFIFTSLLNKTKVRETRRTERKRDKLQQTS